MSVTLTLNPIMSVNEEEHGEEHHEPTLSQRFHLVEEHLTAVKHVVWGSSDRVLEEIKAYAGFSCIFFLVILIVLGVFFAEWRASEKDVLEQLTKLNQALACHDH